MKTVRTRIAPSPTGEDLHIGNAYTALINFILARKYKGKFIIRIEDTDRTRLVEGSEKRILASLNWLGLAYDESPDTPGPYKPYRQSERLPVYKQYIDQLIESGNAYYCFCSPKRLDEMRKNQQEKGQPTLYDGTCKLIPKEIAQKRSESETHVIRLNVPDTGITSFDDVIRGEISFENKLIDDQVLIKSDGFPTYHFGVVVDDHLMEISHVIRGEEWISSTPKHILLYTAFGWELPKFAHLPLLRNPDKSKLSKRKNPVWVYWYKKQGILPEALLNYLGLMGWSMSDGRDKFTLDEMMKEFRLEDIKTTAPIFDLEKLKWLNKQYIQELPSDEYKKLIEQTNDLKIHEKDFVRLSESIVKPRISTLAEYKTIANFFHEQPVSYELDLKKYAPAIKNIRDLLNSIGDADWKANTLGSKLQDLAKNLGIKNSEFFMVLRVAVTGKKVTPPLNESLEILGKEKTLEYLAKSTD